MKLPKLTEVLELKPCRTSKEKAQRLVHRYAPSAPPGRCCPSPAPPAPGLAALEAHMIYWIARYYGETPTHTDVIMTMSGLELASVALKTVAIEGANSGPGGRLGSERAPSPAASSRASARRSFITLKKSTRVDSSTGSWSPTPELGSRRRAASSPLKLRQIVRSRLGGDRVELERVLRRRGRGQTAARRRRIERHQVRAHRSDDIAAPREHQRSPRPWARACRTPGIASSPPPGSRCRHALTARTWASRSAASFPPRPARCSRRSPDRSSSRKTHSAPRRHSPPACNPGLQRSPTRHRRPPPSSTWLHSRW